MSGCLDTEELSVKQYASIHGVSGETVRGWIRAGHIKATTVMVPELRIQATEKPPDLTRGRPRGSKKPPA